MCIRYFLNYRIFDLKIWFFGFGVKEININIEKFYFKVIYIIFVYDEEIIR